jgi:hypothetical protein
MPKEFTKMLKTLPKMNTIHNKMDYPDHKIVVYEGKVFIKANNEVYIFEKVQVKIWWQPRISYYFEINPNDEDLKVFFNKEYLLEMSIDGLNFQETIITSYFNNLLGLATKKMEIGKRPESFKEVFMELPNFQEFHGLWVNANNVMKTNRIEINTDSVSHVSKIN